MCMYVNVCAHVWVGVHVCVIECIYSYVRERETHTIECWRRAQCGRHSRTWPLRWSPTEREREKERGGGGVVRRESIVYVCWCGCECECECECECGYECECEWVGGMSESIRE